VKTQIYTYFTQIPDRTGASKLLYNSEGWVRATLRLETAGPVAVGTREEIAPVLSGKGVLLPPGDTDSVTFIIPAGQRLFITAEAVHRVKFTIEPVPWLEQILSGMGIGFNSLAGLLGRIARTAPAKVIMPNESGRPPCPEHLREYQKLKGGR